MTSRRVRSASGLRVFWEKPLGDEKALTVMARSLEGIGIYTSLGRPDKSFVLNLATWRARLVNPLKSAGQKHV